MFWMNPAAAGQRVGAAASEPPSRLTLHIANDTFASERDRHFTNGLRIDWVPGRASKLKLFGLIPAMGRLLGADDDHPHRSYLQIGQDIFTPDDLSQTALIPDERPYAGWLYVTFGAAVQRNRRLDRLELTLGMVGPASLAGDAQRTWHRWFNFQPPLGWKNQLKNEPGLLLTFSRQYRLPIVGGTRGWSLQVLPQFSAGLGNIYTYAGVGGIVRFGQNLPGDFGPGRLGPGLPGTTDLGIIDRTGKGPALGWYVFLGAEARVMFRNIFVDGNTFRDSHSVDRRWIVLDATAGFTLIMDRLGFLPPLRLTYAFVLRSEEFKGQRKPDRFGRISLSFPL